MIRAAVAADVDEITAGALRAFADSAISNPLPELVRQIAIATVARSLAIVAEGEGGAIVGALGLVRRQWEFSGEPYLTDCCTFASDPRAFAQLVAAGRAVARRVGLPLYLGFCSCMGADLRLRLYKLHGGELVGGLLLFR